MRVIKQKQNGYRVCPLREYLVLAVIPTLIIVVAFLMGWTENLPPYHAGYPLGCILGIIAMLYMGTNQFDIDKNGITQRVFGIRIRHVLWSEVERVGTGYTGGETAVVITVKGSKHYEPLTKTGRRRDADTFSMLHPRGCIVIDKASITRPLIEEFYGELDYECAPRKDS